MTAISQSTGFGALSPDAILDALEGIGLACDGRILALNSYENRVYQIGIEDAEPLIAKFYRPQRWTDAAIIEEHQYTLALAAEEIPVVAPCLGEQGQSLYHHGAYRFALYPCRGGRAPELDDPDQLEQMGRFVARIHALGATQAFKHRPTLDIQQFGVQAREFLLSHDFLPEHMREAYESLSLDLIEQVKCCYQRAGTVQNIRLHGDCHPGNILWRDQVPHIVDFDDARMGPAIQDLWMFLSGDRTYMTARLADVLEGYTQFHEFNPAELYLVEALRTLRMIHYAAWLASRWGDPAFPLAFPWFNTVRYWEAHVLSLREQRALLDEPPLVWG